jgi:hypothetical protein
MGTILDTSGQKRTRMKRPLAGIRILSVEQYAAGPYGTQLLADLGAERSEEHTSELQSLRT